MIYFVDEDIHEIELYAIELDNRGYQTVILRNADEAFATIPKAKNIELIILDVMLATSGGKTSRYTSFQTDSFVTTGLFLLEELVDQHSSNKCLGIPEKVVLFSAASMVWVVEKINNAKEKHGIHYLDKKEYDDAFQFGEDIEKILKKVNKR